MHDLTLVDLYEAAASLDPEAREAFIRHLAEHRPDLTASLRVLFDAPVPTGDVLPPMPALHLDPIEPGTQLGSFVVAEQIGEGGMGQVYRAVQEPLGRDVALKVVALGTYATPAQLQRFRAERDLVGSFDHPHIAHVYGGGETPDGVPYFAMELVEGQPITDWCAARRLAERDRVALFCQVCEAVAFAHQRLVVHRDLKPSNILVREDGAGRPIVKLLDFGIAAVLADPEESTTAELGAMTPAYAAPEQARGEGITTATDVYALGVVLHELLTGHRPEVATERLDGDLGAIVTRALQDEPAHRYPSAQALADDLQRFLGRLPVQARPAKAGYRVGRFVARHRPAVSAAVLATLVLIAVVGVYTWQLQQERDNATAEAQRTQQVQDFMLMLLEGGEPTAQPSDTLRLSTVIEYGTTRAVELADQPDIQIELLETLSALLAHRGDYERADSLLSRALSAWETMPDADERDRGDLLMRQSRLRIDQQRWADAERLAQEGLAIMLAEAGREDTTVAKARAILGFALHRLERFDEAIEQSESAAALWEQAGNEIERGLALDRAVKAYTILGAYERADSLAHIVLSIDQRELGDYHPYVAADYVNLGNIRYQMEDGDAAEDYYRKALAIRLTHYEEDHPAILLNKTILVKALVLTGKLSEAESILNEVLVLQRARYPQPHTDVALTVSEMAHVARAREDHARAVQFFSEAADLYLATTGEESKNYLIAQANLGGALSSTGELGEAETTLRSVLGVLERVLPEGHDNTARAHIRLGSVLVKAGRGQEGKRHLAEGLRMLETNGVAPDSPWVERARRELEALEGGAETAI
ncbi:MAG: serine/threonine-protein kinase [Bacteroidota bacterium]